LAGVAPVYGQHTSHWQTNGSIDGAIGDTQTPDDIDGILGNQAQAIMGALDRIRALRGKRRAA